MTYKELSSAEKEIIDTLQDAKKNNLPAYIAMLGLLANGKNDEFLKKMVLPYYSKRAMKRAIKSLREYQACCKEGRDAAERSISFIRRVLLGRYDPAEICFAVVEGTALM